jgi:2-oxoisovalerate dehydrogenase E2 component (dihydrolipoyl transacylase)
MGEHVIKLPDVGEGVAEAELVEWHVKVGDVVREDTVLAAVMTDKATVEIPSPVEGEVAWLGGEIGDRIAVGSPLIRLKTAGAGVTETAAEAREAAPAMDSGEGEAPIADGMAEEGENLPPPEPRHSEPIPAPAEKPETTPARRRATTAALAGAPRPEGERPLASPAVRLRAKEAGIDLRQVRGSGPAGRILHEDLEAFLRQGPSGATAPGLAPDNSVEEIRVVGLRRRIAERMELTRSRVVPITYVEEVDVTALEELRGKLNAEKRADRPKLTLIPFLMRAIVRTVREQPRMNAHYDDEAHVIRRFGGVHIGIAAQTDTGLVVPVARHCEARDLWDCATELSRLSDAAKSGTATREELSGSTITITSLGALGGIVTTPVLNHPEVAIVGVNKIAVRPLWDGRDFVPRRVMNLSSSFDHRVIDGWDAAVFVQRLKTLLETPALIFVEG